MSRRPARTDGEAQAEGHVPNGVDGAVHGRVADVDEVAQLGHHGAVHHADGEAQAGVGHDQVVDATRQWDLCGQKRCLVDGNQQRPKKQKEKRCRESEEI